jgi:hypothetical protein
MNDAENRGKNGPAPAFSLDDAVIRIDASCRTTATWTRVVGLIVLVWAIASLAVGGFVAATYARSEHGSDGAAERFESYADCMESSDTTATECETAFPDASF